MHVFPITDMMTTTGIDGGGGGGGNVATVMGGMTLLVVGWWFVDAYVMNGAENRLRGKMQQEERERYDRYQAERARKAYIEPKDYWTEDELKPYDGTLDDEEGPILLAADGLVFNVYKGRNFYGTVFQIIVFFVCVKCVFFVFHNASYLDKNQIMCISLPHLHAFLY